MMCNLQYNNFAIKGIINFILFSIQKFDGVFHQLSRIIPAQCRWRYDKSANGFTVTNETLNPSLKGRHKKLYANGFVVSIEFLISFSATERRTVIAGNDGLGISPKYHLCGKIPFKIIPSLPSEIKPIARSPAGAQTAPTYPHPPSRAAESSFQFHPHSRSGFRLRPPPCGKG